MARIDKILSDFISDCNLRGMSKDSIRSYKSTLSIFFEFLREKGVSTDKVDREVLKDFINYLRADRGIGPKTMENYFASMSSFYKYLMFEEKINYNPILPVRERYVRQYKKANGNNHNGKKVLTLDQMSTLINSIMDSRDRAVVTLLAKTGIRRGELLSLDISDINWENYSITLKPTPKRSNRLLFFDDETARQLKSYLRIREQTYTKGTKALFVGERGERLSGNTIYRIVTKYAERLGYHDPSSDKTDDHLSPHCLRHFFTTEMRRAGMPREFIQELRGDIRKGAIDIYDHIDPKELRESYLACVPQFGV